MKHVIEFHLGIVSKRGDEGTFTSRAKMYWAKSYITVATTMELHYACEWNSFR